MIELPCNGCGKTLKVADDMAGKRGKCPRCKATLTVPAVDQNDGEIDLEGLRELLPDDPIPVAPRRVPVRAVALRPNRQVAQEKPSRREAERPARRLPVLSLLLLFAAIAIAVIWRSGRVQEFASYSTDLVPRSDGRNDFEADVNRTSALNSNTAAREDADSQRRVADDARGRSLKIIAQQKASLRAFIQNVEPFERELRSIVNAQNIGVNYPDFGNRVRRLADAYDYIPDGSGIPSFTIPDGIGNLKTGNGTFMAYGVSVRPAAQAILHSRKIILDAWKTGITNPEFGGMGIVQDGFKQNFEYFFSRNDSARSALNMSDDEWLKMFPQ